MRVTFRQSLVLHTIKERTELDAEKIHYATRSSLISKGLIEQCRRMYFGPRSLRYRLTVAGHQWVKDHPMTIGNLL